MPAPLRREEAKFLTRRRLLDAAAKLLGENGYGGLSASAVARGAGVAQPTFYVHFRDKEDLVRTLADEKIGALRSRLRDARERVRAGQGVDAVRETFRLPLETLLETPALFRLFVGAARDPGSPLAEQSRRLHDELRKDLAEDLVSLGLPASSARERQQVEMIADSMIAQTEALGLGYLDGRYDDLDTVVDVLTRFAVGILGL